jgi:hypothetical protein
VALEGRCGRPFLEDTWMLRLSQYTGDNEERNGCTKDLPVFLLGSDSMDKRKREFSFSQIFSKSFVGVVLKEWLV